METAIVIYLIIFLLMVVVGIIYCVHDNIRMRDENDILIKRMIELQKTINSINGKEYKNKYVDSIWASRKDNRFR